MTTVNPYLVFEGNCEDAFNFYRSAFRVEFRFMGRYKDIPKSDRHHFAPGTDEKIMHVSLPISAETILMGCDNAEHSGETTQRGNNFSLSVTTDSQEEADRLFEELSADGQIKMNMEETFWGSYFGVFTDKFGINWTISFDHPRY
jgi:PhnB protein